MLLTDATSISTFDSSTIQLLTVLEIVLFENEWMSLHTHLDTDETIVFRKFECYREIIIEN